MTKWWIAVWATLAAAGSARADGSFNGNQLYAFGQQYEALRDGRANDPWQAGLFTGFVLGASRMLHALAIAVENSKYCPLSSTTLEQQSDIVMKYLRANPEQRNEGPALLVQLALQGAFPCPGATAPKPAPKESE